MTFQRYQNPDHPDWPLLWELYQQSFPVCELRLEEDHRKAMTTRSDFYCVGIWEDNAFLGLIFYWYNGDFCYVEHFAIHPMHRGKQYGSHCLTEFCKQFPQVILEIDLPVDDISIRRQHFYERLGFLVSGYQHEHPPYRIQDKPHQLLALSYPNPISREQQKEFLTYREQDIMRYSEPKRHETER